MSNPVNLLGYHLTFDSEFGGASDLGQFGTAFPWGDTTLYNNHEAENYIGTPAGSAGSPFAVAGGALTITASPLPSGGLPYSSGLLQTSASFSQNTGYFEIRAAMPSAAGFWPAFWMLPAGQGYPEIDILEQPNNSGSSTEYWNHTSTPTDSSGGFYNTGVNVFSGYHTYGFLWTATSIQYTFDGNLIGSAHATPAALASVKMYLIANLAVGGAGSWPGQPTVAGSSSTYSIDYIRAYSNDPTVPAVVQEPISSPDGIDTTPLLVLAPAPTPAPIGAGADALVLTISGDSYQYINPQFTVTIDGVPMGGVLTAVGRHVYLQTQDFTFLGAFGSGTHTVGVNFINNADGPDGDRNLFVSAGTIDGVAIPAAVLNEYGGGTQTFSFTGPNAPPPPVPPVPVTIGTGTDALVLQIAEDSYQGVNAHFTISVDGVQQGSTQTATASNSLGQTQAFTVLGSFGSGLHQVSIDFLNNDNGPDGDRNLFLISGSIDGTAIPSATLNEYSGGAQSFTFSGPNPVPVPDPSPVSIGVGPDALVLNVAEDAYLAIDAQFTISVDGVQQGTAQTTTASHFYGMSQAFTILGVFGSGSHTVALDFLNPASGSSGTRSLYVNSGTIDGVAIPAAVLTDSAGGTQSFAFTGPNPPPAPTPNPVTIGSGADSLVLKIAGDAYLSVNAQFTISVDGAQQGGTQTALASRILGQSQSFTILGGFGSGTHSVSVSLLNPGSGTTGQRVLYLTGGTIDGVAIPAATLTESAATAQSFAFTGPNPVPSPVVPSPVTIGTGADSLVLHVAEDSYLSVNAQFTISVDGVQQGGTQTALASRVLGQSQAFTILGGFGSGTHSVSVSLLNPGSGTTGQRVLYLTGGTIDGVAIPAATLTENAATAQSFAFTGPNPVPPLPNPVPSPVTIGTGADSLVLQVAEDSYLGVDAQFTISVDGVQQGGTQTVIATRAAGQTQAFTVLGGFGSGTHAVAVNFLNNADGAGGDRNLFVTGGTIDGVGIASAVLNEYAGGTQTFAFTGPNAVVAPPPPSPVTVGAGADSLVLLVAEDSYLGVDANFTISVDGVQQGGALTTTASHAPGQTQAFTVKGAFGATAHLVTVNFLNNGDGPGGDRNLFVTGASVNATVIPGAILNEYAGGPQSFSFTAAPAAVANPAPTSVGTGPDTFQFTVGEAAYLGNAQFTISVDGVQQGGTQTVTALQSAGQSQVFAVNGTFGAGQHTEAVNFLNGVVGSTPATSRSLYVDGITYNGVQTPGSTATLLATGAQSFVTPPAPTDTLSVALTEDAYQGDAMAQISIDGTVLGTPTVTFLNSGGIAQVFTYKGSFGGAAAAHDIGVSFLNDAYGGTPATDRNLYVKAITFDGAAFPQQTALYDAGTVHFPIPALHT